MHPSPAQVGLAQEVLSQREGKMDAERSLKEVLHDIAMVAQHWGEPKALKSQVRSAFDSGRAGALLAVCTVGAAPCVAVTL